MKWNVLETNENVIELINEHVDYDLIIDRIACSTGRTPAQVIGETSKEDIQMIFSTLLANRSIELGEINLGLNDIEKSIVSPHKLTNATRAAKEIANHIKDENNTLYIYSDYDCDGTNSGKVMGNALKEVSSAEVIVHYPERSSGYGLNLEWCHSIVSRHENNLNNIMVITVDNGITKVNEVKFLVEQGVKVIITDHHVSQDKVPNCLIVDPHNRHEVQDKDTLHLCGCAVAFKVAQLVQHEFDIDLMYEHLPNVALATIADVMPFTLENMAFISYGLEIINSKDCPTGIKALINEKKIDVVTVKDVQWSIGPMVNACGRMGHTHLAGELLETTNMVEAKRIAKEIDSLNNTRKKLTNKAVEELAVMDFGDNKTCISFIDHKKYPHGIVGIIAGRSVEMFGRPSIVCQEVNGTCSGSLRSIDGVNMLDLIDNMKKLKLITSYGGHEAACGINFEYDKLEEINNYLNNALILPEPVEEEVEVEEVLNIDMTLPIEYIDLVTHTLINLMPFDNKRRTAPIFAFEDLTVSSIQSVNTTPKNGWLTVKQNGKTLKLFVLGLFEELCEMLGETNGANIDIAGEISKAFWGQHYVINIKDFRTTQ